MEQVTEGATSGSYQFEILDSTSTTGGRKTGLAFNTSSLTGYYVRAGGSATAITLATLAAANSAFSSGGFKEIDATNMPGVYRLDIPDAAFAAGAKSVTVTLKGATGMVQCSRTFQLNKVDLRDAVRGGMTAMPNANAEAAGGLYTRGTGAGQINQPANGMIDNNMVRILGTAVSTPATAGILDVNAKNWNNLATVELPLVPTTAGRKLDVSAGGEAGVDWANVGSPTTVVGLSGTTVKTSTDVETKAADIQARLPAALTANGNMKSSILEFIATVFTEGAAGRMAAAIQQFFNIASPTSTMNRITLVDTTTANTDMRGTDNAATAASLATAKTAIDGIKAKTDSLTFTIAGQVDSNVLTGGGSGLDAAGTRAALGMASANMDTQLAAKATAASIAALNNISTAQVRTEAKGAIADYGGIL